MAVDEWDEPARPRARWLVPAVVIVVLAGVVALGLGVRAVTGDGGDSTRFCQAYDEAAPRVESRTSAARAALSAGNLPAARTALDEAGRELEALVPLAPKAIASDLRTYVELTVDSSDESEKPSTKARMEKAETRVDSYVREECGFEPVI